MLPKILSLKLAPPKYNAISNLQSVIVIAVSFYNWMMNRIEVLTEMTLGKTERNPEEKSNRFEEAWSIYSLKEKLLAVIAGLAIVCFVIFFVLAITGNLGLLIVKSASMQPYMPPGSLVIFRTADADRIKAGQIVVFRDGALSTTLVTHRVVQKIEKDGRVYMKTKGDSNSNSDSVMVDASTLMGRVVCVIPAAGQIMAYVKTPAGFLVLDLLLVFLIASIAIDKLGVSVIAYLETYHFSATKKESVNAEVQPVTKESERSKSASNEYFRHRE